MSPIKRARPGRKGRALLIAPAVPPSSAIGTGITAGEHQFADVVGMVAGDDPHGGDDSPGIFVEAEIVQNHHALAQDFLERRAGFDRQFRLGFALRLQFGGIDIAQTDEGRDLLAEPDPQLALECIAINHAQRLNRQRAGQSRSPACK